MTKTTITTKPSAVKSEKKIEKSFEIPFIDCEIEVAEPTDTLECTLDISDIVFLKCTNVKGVSKFGRVLCRKYKRVKPYKIDFKNKKVVHKCQVFNFATPSPDDGILSCLKSP